MSFTRSALLAALLTASFFTRGAEEKAAKTNEPPTVTMMLPFAVGPGTNKVILRGLNITNATAIRFLDPNETASVQIVARGKATLPDKADPKKLGDVQLELLLTVAGATTRDLPLVVSTPEGDSNTNTLRVIGSGLLAEKEPNGSLKEPQAIGGARFLRGTIDPANDVDVFGFEAKAGQKFRISTLSARHGSTLDPLLTIYDRQGHVLATSDDAEAKEAVLIFTAPRAGAYCLGIIDALDRGGLGNTYLIEFREE